MCFSVIDQVLDQWFISFESLWTKFSALEDLIVILRNVEGLFEISVVGQYQAHQIKGIIEKLL